MAVPLAPIAVHAPTPGAAAARWHRPVAALPVDADADVDAMVRHFGRLTFVPAPHVDGPTKKTRKAPRPPRTAHADLMATILAEDRRDADSYEQLLGTFAIEADVGTAAGPGSARVRYTFELRKVSLKTQHPSSGAPGKRKYLLSLQKGERNFEFGTRYEWPCVAIDYGMCLPGVAPRERSVTIGYICEPDPAHPDDSTIRPLVKRGVIKTFTPLAIRICEYFFPGMPIALEDAACVDTYYRVGESLDAPHVMLSSAKVLTGAKRYSAYGEFGFHTPDKPQSRLDDLVSFYRGYGLLAAFERLLDLDDAKLLAFLTFDDILEDADSYTDDVSFEDAYRDRLRLHRSAYKKNIANLVAAGGTAPAPAGTIAATAKHLVDIACRRSDDPVVDTDYYAQAVPAREAFYRLQYIFVGSFYDRAQTLDMPTWQAYASHNGIGELACVAAAPNRPVHSVPNSPSYSFPSIPPRFSMPMRPSVARALQEKRKDGARLYTRHGKSGLSLTQLTPAQWAAKCGMM